ncbi:DUF1638 domain-containing protein [Hydrogenoanaerobacterium sp.]|uniref:DUF1638 domain-containing protein n=1 Tax=Hydrogenoanaerobacterium sp. TaxID=2953763 RepID=UPI0028968C1F|nr:DUF1638 domain-containing protein [Hydrogenoanaerobacterium sp.]
MRLKVIACKVLTRELGYLSAACPNYLDISWLRQGYHDEPDRLRAILQECIDKIDSGDDPFSCNETVGEFDAIVLGYGLCSNGICGVRSKRYPIVVPRAHDCITLFLGSKERYRDLFDQTSGGVFWYTPGWIENSLVPSETTYAKKYDQYVEKYGEDNAEYLMEMEETWIKGYSAVAYVQMPDIAYPDYRGYSRTCADYLGWDHHEHKGDDTLLRDLIDGNWDNERFLVIPPNSTCEQSYDNSIVKIKD